MVAAGACGSCTQSSLPIVVTTATPECIVQSNIGSLRHADFVSNLVAELIFQLDDDTRELSEHDDFKFIQDHWETTAGDYKQWIKHKEFREMFIAGDFKVLRSAYR